MPFKSLFDVAEWIAAHDGRINQLWKYQERLNKDHLKRIKDLEARQQSIKLHLGILIGVCSILGPLLVTVLTKMVQ